MDRNRPMSYRGTIPNRGLTPIFKDPKRNLSILRDRLFDVPQISWREVGKRYGISGVRAREICWKCIWILSRRSGAENIILDLMRVS